jgi:hypothetical protein
MSKNEINISNFIPGNFKLLGATAYIGKNILVFS